MKASSKSHLFLSYARQDDKQPINQMGQGWVTAFESELKKRYRQYTSRDIDIFFDKNSIGPGRDWKREIGKGLRESRLFLAFLSPNYFISENCLWEWDQYLQLEHSAARGDDGLTPIFFVTPDDLRLSEGQAIVEWLEAMKQKYHPWFAPRSVSISDSQAATAIAFSKDVVQRRNVTAMFELQEWFEHGPDILLDLDAQARLLELKSQPRSDPKDLRTLSERLHSLDRHIAHRLDRLALADLAPGNVELSHEHFVGRHQELRKLHDIMVHGGPQSGGSGMGGRGMIAATFAPGGLGKTALARQYAHAYSEFYAAGGKWFIGCEGLTDLGAAFLKLVDNEQFQSLALRDRTSPPSAEDRYLVAPLELTEEQRKDNSRALERILAYMERATSARGRILLEEFRRKGERGELECHSKADDPPELERPRALVVLDNVDKPELLSATELAQLTGSEWLEVIVTTRMSPDRFGGGDRIFSPLEINTLSHADSVRLLAEFQPDHRFASDQEEEASKRIAEALGGWTIAVEIVAAFLGERARKGQSDTASAFLQLLEENGLAWIDDLSGKHLFDVSQRHSKAKDPIERARENRISTIISWSIEQLSAPARTALEFASLLMPDEMPLQWIRDLTMDRHPEVRNADMVSEQDWISVWSELRSLRLLHPRSKMEHDSEGRETTPDQVWIHRLVAAHVKSKELPDHLAELDRFVYRVAGSFESLVEQTNDTASRSQHRSLFDQVTFFFTEKYPPTDTLLRSAEIVASYEGRHGSLALAIDLESKVLAFRESLQEQNPQSAQAARDVSVSLSKVGDFLSRRGQAGDGEKALDNYQRSLEVRERLLEQNPQAAQAARDVSVSLERVGDFLSRRGQAGDGEKALDNYQRSLEVRERLLEQNRQSAEAARDVSVSLERVGDFLSRRGQAGDGEKALESYQRSLEVRERLLEQNPQSAEAARDVSVSLERVGDFLSRRGQAGDGEKALENYQRSLEVCERLLEQNPQSAQAARDVSVSLDRLGDFLSRRGQAGDGEKALETYQRSLEVCERLLEQNRQSAEAARDVSVSLNKVGDFLSRRGQAGDGEKALESYQRSLEVRERLLEQNPQSAQAARDVSVSLERVGDFLSLRGQAGDGEKALENYQRSLEVCERLLEQNPHSAHAARDVSVSLSKVGDFLSRRGQAGDGEKALENYQRSLEVCERLLEQNPQSAQAARDVSVSLIKVGDFLSLRGQAGDGEKALENYQRSLEVRERLLEQNPQSAEAARDVSVSLIKVGDFLSRRGQAGDGEKALENYQRSLEVCERLLEQNPHSAHAARDVSVSLSKVGDFLSRRGQAGDGEKALENYQRSLEVCERLLEQNPQSAEAARDVSVSLIKVGDFLSLRGQAGDGEKALENYQRSLEVCERLLEQNPQSAQAARDVSVSLERLGDFLSRRGQAGDGEKALELQQRAVEIGMALFASNRQSVFYGRTLAVSLFLAFQRAQGVGQEKKAIEYLSQCFAVLEDLVQGGATLDPEILNLHTQLTGILSND